jgi:hypothetical protein
VGVIERDTIGDHSTEHRSIKVKISNCMYFNNGELRFEKYVSVCVRFGEECHIAYYARFAIQNLMVFIDRKGKMRNPPGVGWVIYILRLEGLGDDWANMS